MRHSRSIDLSLYLVTPEGDDESLEWIIREAVEGGVTIVQLRVKDRPTRYIIEKGKRLLSLLKPLGVPLIVNDRVDIAYAIKADGVHVGQSDLSLKDARSILGKLPLIGLSVETLDQALEAEEAEIDYLGASPVFPTKTKRDCAPPWGLEGLKQLCQVSSHPIVAIGGINQENVAQVSQSGVMGVAVVSAIFDAKDPRHAAHELSKMIKRSIA